MIFLRRPSSPVIKFVRTVINNFSILDYGTRVVIHYSVGRRKFASYSQGRASYMARNARESRWRKRVVVSPPRLITSGCQFDTRAKDARYSRRKIRNPRRPFFKGCRSRCDSHRPLNIVLFLLYKQKIPGEGDVDRKYFIYVTRNSLKDIYIHMIYYTDSLPSRALIKNFLTINKRLFIKPVTRKTVFILINLDISKTF